MDFLRHSAKRKKKSHAQNGQGFRLFKPETVKKDKGERTGVLVAGLCAAGFGVALMLKISVGMTIILSAVLGLFGLILHDMAGRRKWEETLSSSVQTLSRNHDRLVREVARNRDDIHVLKDGLAETAVALEAQGKKISAKTETIEAQMVKTIAEQLGNLGTKKKPSAANIHTPPPANDILELQVSPPPPKAPPQSRFDEAVAPTSVQKQPSEAITRELIRQAIDTNAVDLYLQPIVRLPQRKAAMVEAFARLRLNPSLTLQAVDYMAQARKEMAVPAIDNLLLHRCFSFLRARQDGGGASFMMNISGAALGDSGFMNDLVAWIARNRSLAPRLVLEMTQHDLITLNNHLVPVLDGLSMLGCRFSMDNVRQRQIDVGFLKSRHIRFLKMDAQWLLKEGQAPGGYSRIIRLKRQLDAAGIDLIVEKIEREQTLKEILDYGIDYGQGYLFGKPDRAAAFAASVVTATKAFPRAEWG
jgi:cyclic-di-GMP phosphodiesterase TipF (flagellum assembly factor)